MKKKIALLLVAAMTVASLVACGNSAADAPAAAETEAPAEETPAEETEAPAEEAAEAPAAEAGSVAVFYYTYGDTYISSVRSALDAALHIRIMTATTARQPRQNRSIQRSLRVLRFWW